MPKDPSYLTGGATGSLLAAGGGALGDASSGATDAAATFLTQLADILERTNTTDAQGRRVAAWTSADADVPCRLHRAGTPREVVDGSGVKVVVVFQCDFALGTAIGPANRVTIGSATFEVVDTNAGLADAALLTVWLTRINPQ